MQIHRIDIPVPSDTSTSASAPGTNPTHGPATAASRKNEAERAAGGSELDRLTRQLDGISDVRPDVVAAAKLRVQGGDYLTRAAAEQTAAAILDTDV